MSRRTISKPMAINADTYFRLRVQRYVAGEWQSIGFHNQPFASHAEADIAARLLRVKIAKNDPRGVYSVTIATVHAS